MGICCEKVKVLDDVLCMMHVELLRLFHAAIVILSIISAYGGGYCSWCTISARPVSAWTVRTPKHVVVGPPKNGAAIPLRSKQQWMTELQRCVTLEDVVNRMGPLSAGTPLLDVEVYSLILVRVSKLLMALGNQGQMVSHPHVTDFVGSNPTMTGVSFRKFTASVITSLFTSGLTKNIDALVDGTKACAIMSRLVSSYDPDFNKVSIIDTCRQFWTDTGPVLVPQMQDHHLSGIAWSLDSFVAASGVPNIEIVHVTYPKAILDAYNALQLPFRILPSCLSNMNGANHATLGSITVPFLVSEVEFRTDEILAAGSEDSVMERRLTAWQGDVGVAPFAYSGKSMERWDWTPTILRIRNHLQRVTGQYYDGCLLNLYPDGRSGMRYHQDPDQGVLWDYDTAVVSIGAARRFAFRSIPSPTPRNAATMQPKPHNFVVMDGDVTYMFGNCQQRFQHAVKNAEPKTETAPRISLVFKRTCRGNQTTQCES
jgi:alkylated DNA repair dioxygenase AlkB